MVEKKYGHLQPRNIPATEAPVFHGGVAVVEHESSVMCEVRMAMETVSSQPSTRAEIDAFSMLKMLLATGDSSRLYKEIVTNRELTNAVAAIAEFDRRAGIFMIVSSVPPENVKAFTAATYQEIRKLAEDLTQAELDKVKALTELRLLRNAEINDNVCFVQAIEVQEGLTPSSSAELAVRLQQISVEDVKRAAGKLLQSPPVFGAAVPVGTDRKLFPTMEELVAMRNGKYNEIKSLNPSKKLDNGSSI